MILLLSQRDAFLLKQDDQAVEYQSRQMTMVGVTSLSLHIYFQNDIIFSAIFFKHFVQEKLCCHENGDQKDHEKTNPCCSTIIHSGEDFHVPEMPQLSSQQLFVCFLGLFGEISVSVCQKATRCHNINKNYEWKLDFTLT